MRLVILEFQAISYIINNSLMNTWSGKSEYDPASSLSFIYIASDDNTNAGSGPRNS